MKEFSQERFGPNLPAAAGGSPTNESRNPRSRAAAPSEAGPAPRRGGSRSSRRRDGLRASSMLAKLKAGNSAARTGNGDQQEGTDFVGLLQGLVAIESRESFPTS